MITRETFDKFLLELSRTTLGFRRKIVLLERAIKIVKNEAKLKEMGEYQCKFCKVDLEIGEALDCKDPDLRVEYTSYDKGQLILCLKCPKCGYSETLT